MIDWRKGGLSGSVLRLARQDMKAHLRDNSAARRVRYSLPHRIVRGFSASVHSAHFCVCTFLLIWPSSLWKLSLLTLRRTICPSGRLSIRHLARRPILFY